jgi:AcrR family transcriptional regulator
MQAISKSLFVAAPLPSDHRARLLEGMLCALSEKGYMELSVMDIVRHAKVSKRTFYEHFADKEACFLASYAALSDELLGRIASAAARGGSAEERLSAAILAYFGALQEQRRFLRAFLSEVHAAGPRALALRRQILQRFADLLRSTAEAERAQRKDVRVLSPELATAIVGGIHELILCTLEEGRIDRLSEVARTSYELLYAVLLNPTQQAPQKPAPRPAKRR